MNGDDLMQDSPPPQFGLIDLVESFTAFRHEYRNQSREIRGAQSHLEELVQRIERLVAGSNIQSQPTQTAQPATAPQNSSAALESWTMTLIEFDIQWTRAIEAATRNVEFLRKQREQTEVAIEEAISSMSGFRRLMAAPLVKRLRGLRIENPPAETMTDGLAILLGKLRQSLSEYQIERRDAMDKPFDGTWMRSIGTLVDPARPSGNVAQQICPAYCRQTRVLKFADVRVATTA